MYFGQVVLTGINGSRVVQYQRQNVSPVWSNYDDLTRPRKSPPLLYTDISISCVPVVTHSHSTWWWSDAFTYNARIKPGFMVHDIAMETSGNYFYSLEVGAVPFLVGFFEIKKRERVKKVEKIIKQ